MNSKSTCPRCGTTVPPEAPRGLCPRCLMDGALATEPQAEATPAPSVEELSSVFPQIEVFELLGSGGMGRVYKARQTHLDRIVALKILPPELASDPAFAERFAREARALAKLNHPNIVQCYDFGRSSLTTAGISYFYLLLEFVDGVNLRQTMHAGALSAREALGIVPRLCDALHYAHEQGVLHRDIKPENILVDKKGRVKIADFGLARFHKGDEDTNAMTLTMSGAQLGTAAYMAPEQIEQPHDVDHRADIYSLGVVFYEMLTGELPLGRFAAPSETSGVDPRLDSVVFRTLEKQKERRYQSADEVQSQVETIAGTPTPNPDAAFSSAARPESPDAIKTGSALAFPPSWMSTWNWIWRQPFLLQRGHLTLQPHQLVYQSPKASLSISVDAIESIALTPLSFAREPLGRCPIRIRWRDAADRVQTTCLLPGSASWLTPLSEEQTITDAWIQALCEAASARQGARPEIALENQATAAGATPAIPALPYIVWAMICLFAGLVALSLLTSGAWIIGLPMGVAVAAVSFGVWRRRQGESLVSEVAGFSSKPPRSPEPDPPTPSPAFSSPAPATSSPPPLSEPEPDPLPKRAWKQAKGAAVAGAAALRSKSRPDTSEETPPAPTYSKLSLWAFGFATLGWALIMTGPVIGCVLGWAALSRIRRSEKPLKGRGLALFAALQAPLILLVGFLGTGAFALWDSDLMPVPYTLGILALATIVFLALRLLFRCARVRGFWAWRKKAGFAALLLGAAVLATTTWAIEDLQDEWPLTGSLATAYFADGRGDTTRSSRALTKLLEEGPYGEELHVRKRSRRSRTVEASVATAYPDDGMRFLEDVARAYPDLRMTMSSRNRRGWNPYGPQGEELFLIFSAIGCFSGICFAFSGFRSGSVGLILALGLSITLYQLKLPSPLGYPLVKSLPHQLEKPTSSTPNFPTHIDGIRLQ